MFAGGLRLRIAPEHSGDLEDPPFPFQGVDRGLREPVMVPLFDPKVLMPREASWARWVITNT